MNSPSYGPPPPTVIHLGRGPGKNLASAGSIVTVGVLHAVLLVLIVYCFTALWPAPTVVARPDREPEHGQNKTNAVGIQKDNAILTNGVSQLFGADVTLNDEGRLLVIVLLSGALGASVHALRSIAWYVGNRSFVSSWLFYYYLRPFMGAGLAGVFYFVIRGGFFSPGAKFSETSPFGFCAVSALIGLFSENAVLKLKDIADVIFVKPKSGTDAVPQTTNSGPPPPNPPLPPTSPVAPTTPVAGNPGALNPPPPKH